MNRAHEKWENWKLEKEKRFGRIKLDSEELLVQWAPREQSRLGLEVMTRRRRPHTEFEARHWDQLSADAMRNVNLLFLCQTREVCLVCVLLGCVE